MASLIWLTGLLIAALGVGIVLRPALLTGMLKFIHTPPALYLVGVIRAVLGVIFLVWARSCNHPGVIITLGILMICGGAFLFLTPKARLNRIIDFFLRRPDWIRRVWGLVAIAFGTLIIWAGWLN
jgi:uncharacterized protein YjeT (DUF2065 family)